MLTSSLHYFQVVSGDAEMSSPDPAAPDVSSSSHQGLEGVSAVPSGSGLTFMMESSSCEEDDNPSFRIPGGFEPEPEKVGRIVPGAAADEEDEDQPEESIEEDEDFEVEDEEDSDVTAAKRGRELTDKYLAGK